MITELLIGFSIGVIVIIIYLLFKNKKIYKKHINTVTFILTGFLFFTMGVFITSGTTYLIMIDNNTDKSIMDMVVPILKLSIMVIEIYLVPDFYFVLTNLILQIIKDKTDIIK